jgi:hypothetical protein
MKKKRFPLFILAAFFCLLQGSCGIEDYYYLYPVTKENGAITVTGNDMARVTLPQLPALSATYFTHFTIYYRIYVTDEYVQDSSTEQGLSRINSTLAQDYSNFAQYIDSETNVNTNIGALFTNRNYYPLEVQGSSMSQNVLNPSSQGQTVTLDFAAGKNPIIAIRGQTFALWRSTNDGKFSPQPPNRYFVNHSDLYNPSFINANNNADVVNKSNMTLATRYTYAALFIVVTGLDANYSPLYSTPAFIGVLNLPEPF